MDDRTLVEQVLSGDVQAFRLLIKKHERIVSHMIGRLVKTQEECEELCQDVFLRVYDNLAEFQFQSKLSTWIATIAYRQAINHLRKQKMFFSEIPDEDRFTQRFVNHESPERVMEEVDLDEYVLKLVDDLPTQYKVILTLFHVDGLNYSEICDVTKLPEGTVKNYLFRARNLLKEKVKQHLGKEELL